MPTATTTQAGREVLTPEAEKILNDRERRRQNQLRAADALNGRVDTTTPLVGRAPLETLPEPPAQHAPKPQATFTIHALMDDFPFEVSFAGSADQLAATVQRLRDLGAVPPTPAARAAVEAEKERSAPICQCDACDRYGQPMKESSKQPGSHYCPGKIGMKAGQPIYCKSKG